MDASLTEITAEVSAERLRQITLDLVRTPSPTGDCACAARVYAGILGDIGLDARVVPHQGFRSSPSVVAALVGDEPGPTLQLDGHLDTIHAPHAPARVAHGRIFGRGAADMKSGLAIMSEVARVLWHHRDAFAGTLLVTAHGMHEAPHGLGETLRLLIEAGHVGNAVICVEGDAHGLAIAGKGLGIFDVTFGREGDAVHELAAAPRMPHPILSATRFIDALQAENQKSASVELPAGLGSESYFVGVCEGGDFYNRLPTRCRVVGTRRYGPSREFAEVDAELRSIVKRVQEGTGSTARVTFWRQRDGFALEPETSVVVALRRAYREHHGGTLPLTAMHYVADNSIFVREAAVPAVQYGVGLGRAHADEEWVDLHDIVDVTRVLVLTALHYLRPTS